MRWGGGLFLVSLPFIFGAATKQLFKLAFWTRFDIWAAMLSCLYSLAGLLCSTLPYLWTLYLLIGLHKFWVATKRWCGATWPIVKAWGKRKWRQLRAYFRTAALEEANRPDRTIL